jgi:hypothetical protein
MEIIARAGNRSAPTNGSMGGGGMGQFGNGFSAGGGQAQEPLGELVLNLKNFLFSFFVNYY